MQLLDVRDLNVTFHGKQKDSHIVKGVSFTVDQGDRLAILGESGSGKSTLGRILVGLLKPTKGTYLFQGENPYGSKAGKRLLSRNISIVFQDYNTKVNSRFTIREIILESLTLLAKKEGTKLDADGEIKMRPSALWMPIPKCKSWTCSVTCTVN